MIAHIPALADPATLPPQARLREIAELLARGYLRARVPPTARQVANPASPGTAPSPAVGRNLLAEVTENEPSCGHRERAGSPTRGSRPTTEAQT